MIFSFLNYIKPTHYFGLPRKDNTYVFPKVSLLPNSIKNQLVIDKRYKSKLSREYDLSWQALQKGYIGNVETYTIFNRLPVYDEYLFIRKYFNPIWAFYILIIRIVSFHNPYKELAAWLGTKKIKRNDYLKTPIDYNEWSHFESQLIKDNPLISVVIPTLNRYNYLKDVLHDLENQTYVNFKIIVVDQSTPFRADFYKDFNLTIRVIHQEEKALWKARNSAIQASNATLIALSEDDVRVNSDWLHNHIKCLDFFKASISAGVFYKKDTKLPQERSFFAVASQFATGNALLYKSVFNEIGLFDRQFEKQRMGDGEFGLRAYLAEYISISNPFAACIDVKASEGGLREMGSWDGFRPKKWFSPRPIPSVLYFYRKYFGTKKSILALLNAVPPSVIPYKYKRSKPMLLLGVLFSILVMPIILLQVYISWKAASNKLKKGALIDEL